MSPMNHEGLFAIAYIGDFGVSLGIERASQDAKRLSLTFPQNTR